VELLALHDLALWAAAAVNLPKKLGGLRADIAEACTRFLTQRRGQPPVDPPDLGLLPQPRIGSV
jgi:hypothetical protein